MCIYKTDISNSSIGLQDYITLHRRKCLKVHCLRDPHRGLRRADAGVAHRAHLPVESRDYHEVSIINNNLKIRDPCLCECGNGGRRAVQVLPAGDLDTDMRSDIT